jgi:hypothetical protein
MIRRRVLATAVGAALAVSCSVVPGAAQASNSSATSAYVRANYALVAAGKSHLGASVSAYKGVLAKVRRDCPRAAEGSPQNPDSTKLSNEVIGAMVLSAGVPDRPAIATYLRVVKGISWSNGSLTRAVRTYASSLRKLYGLSVPELCGDIRAWKASGYKTLPASTVSFVEVFYPNWVALGLQPSGLSRFESGSLRSLAHSAARFEYQLTNAEAEAVETWGDIMNALELWP